MNTSFPNIISITDLRRNFGEITANLDKIEEIILTKGGEPFAILKSAPEVKRKMLKKSAGVWKGTSLDNEKIWREVLKRKSRKASISI